MSLKEIEKKYGVDFGRPNDTELRDYLREKGWAALADFLTQRTMTNKQSQEWGRHKDQAMNAIKGNERTRPCDNDGCCEHTALHPIRYVDAAEEIAFYVSSVEKQAEERGYERGVKECLAVIDHKRSWIPGSEDYENYADYKLAEVEEELKSKLTHPKGD